MNLQNSRDLEFNEEIKKSLQNCKNSKTRELYVRGVLFIFNLQKQQQLFEKKKFSKRHLLLGSWFLGFL